MLIFGCYRRPAILAAVLVSLAACSGGDSGWRRANTSDATRGRDYDSCHAEARAAAGPSLGIDQDISASRGADWRQSGRTDAIEQNSSPGDDVFHFELTSCMQGKGYSEQ